MDISNEDLKRLHEICETILDQAMLKEKADNKIDSKFKFWVEVLINDLTIKIGRDKEATAEFQAGVAIMKAMQS